MKRISFRKGVRLFSACWILLGLVLFAYSELQLIGSPQMPELVVTVQKDSAEDAIQRWNQRRLREATYLWREENSSEGDTFTAGLAAYRIGSITHDPLWVAFAKDKLLEATETLSQFAQARAWLGSAHALIARDYPIQGYWQVFPGIGFARIYNVLQANKYLDEAVALDEFDPISRLIRASTLSAMPDIFVSKESVGNDMRLLLSWVEDPSSNPKYKQVLQYETFRDEFYLAYAQWLEARGDKAAAKNAWDKLSRRAGIKEIKEFARWKATSLTQLQ
ncbi:hypothetical protein [Polycladidibacter stylochi]|uniref:hypothetical protein n=1 Tax=Polycladidibacter stylochi TaxID=1807766 RepID=UPI00082F158C|nr:hypothetical protein [Pseudovibrio stylochi]